MVATEIVTDHDGVRTLKTLLRNHAETYTYVAFGKYYVFFTDEKLLNFMKASKKSYVSFEIKVLNFAPSGLTFSMQCRVNKEGDAMELVHGKTKRLPSLAILRDSKKLAKYHKEMADALLNPLNAIYWNTEGNKINMLKIKEIVY